MLFFQVLLPLIFNNAFVYYFDSKKIVNYCNEDNSKIPKVGNVVLVEFGKQKIWGLIVKELSFEEFELELKNSKINIDKVKNILTIAPQVFFNPNIIAFIDYISAYNLAKKGLVFRAFLSVLANNLQKLVKKSCKEKSLQSKKKPKITQLKADLIENFKQVNLELIKLKSLSLQQELICNQIWQNINFA